MDYTDTGNTMDESQNKPDAPLPPQILYWHTAWFHLYKSLRHTNPSVAPEGSSMAAWDEGGAEVGGRDS